MDRNKLNDVLAEPELDNQEFKEVFAFVENITGQNVDLDKLTPEDVERWNCRFNEVLNQLFKLPSRGTFGGNDDDIT